MPVDRPPLALALSFVADEEGADALGRAFYCDGDMGERTTLREILTDNDGTLTHDEIGELCAVDVGATACIGLLFFTRMATDHDRRESQIADLCEECRDVDDGTGTLRGVVENAIDADPFVAAVEIRAIVRDAEESHRRDVDDDRRD